jgi:hypothetical protein
MRVVQKTDTLLCYKIISIHETIVIVIQYFFERFGFIEFEFRAKFLFQKRR